MSFDVYFQGFADGEMSTAGGAEMRSVLEPHVLVGDVDSGYFEIEFGDGHADVYLDQHSMMANHVFGDGPWELLVRGARAANWVIIPMGRSTCVTDPAQEAHLPAELRVDVVHVRSGADLVAVVRATPPDPTFWDSSSSPW